MQTSFVIPVKNDARRLARCLKSLPGSNDDVQTVVVDNGSSDGSIGVAEDAGATVLEIPDKRVSELRNIGAARASGMLLAFVDADHELGPGWLDAAVSALDDRSVGATGAMCLPPPDGTWVQQMYGHLRGRTVGRQDVNWLGAGNMVVRREAFEQVGGFDTSLEACEDVDLCRRLLGAGWRIVADENLVNVHLGDPATLRALFRAERWRGRDNMKVSLRPPVRPRELPGIILPPLTLALAAVTVIALVVAGWSGSWWLFAGAAVPLLLIPMLKVVRMAGRAGTWNPSFLARAWSVAATYDAARAVALVGRAAHHRVR